MTTVILMANKFLFLLYSKCSFRCITEMQQNGCIFSQERRMLRAGDDLGTILLDLVKNLDILSHSGIAMNVFN